LRAFFQQLTDGYPATEILPALIKGQLERTYWSRDQKSPDDHEIMNLLLEMHLAPIKSAQDVAFKDWVDVLRERTDMVPAAVGNEVFRALEEREGATLLGALEKR
jgi:hypothetical protein